jgi:hypothetical protein
MKRPERVRIYSGLFLGFYLARPNLLEYRALHIGGANARAWLNGRGLSDDTLWHWQIGYWPGQHTESLTCAGLSVPCGIVIPGTVGNKVWYLKVRRAKGSPKYIQVNGGRPALSALTLSAAMMLLWFAKASSMPCCYTRTPVICAA